MASRFTRQLDPFPEAIGQTVFGDTNATKCKNGFLPQNFNPWSDCNKRRSVLLGSLTALRNPQVPIDEIRFCATQNAETRRRISTRRITGKSGIVFYRSIQ
jgi:hypothetical protein